MKKLSVNLYDTYNGYINYKIACYRLHVEKMLVQHTKNYPSF